MQRTLKKKEYVLIVELDKKVYPTARPVTTGIINQWYQNNPEFGFIFEENQRMMGMCVAIPLNKKGWEDLTNGRLAEADTDSSTIFDNSRDKEIGIHIYHTERFSQDKGFYKGALKQLAKVVGNLRTKNLELRVIGFSGLAVSTSGMGLFYNKFNCREREFINPEHILSKKGKLEIVESPSQKELSEKIKQGYEYVIRCKVLVLYSNEPSIVWDYLK